MVRPFSVICRVMINEKFQSNLSQIRQTQPYLFSLKHECVFRLHRPSSGHYFKNFQNKVKIQGGSQKDTELLKNYLKYLYKFETSVPFKVLFPWALWQFQLLFFSKGNRISHTHVRTRALFFKISHFNFSKNRQTYWQTLRKKCQNKWHEARSAMSIGILARNIAGSPYLVAEPWTTSRSRGRFKFRKYLGPPSYRAIIIHTLGSHMCYNSHYNVQLYKTKYSRWLWRPSRITHQDILYEIK